MTDNILSLCYTFKCVILTHIKIGSLVSIFLSQLFYSVPFRWKDHFARHTYVVFFNCAVVPFPMVCTHFWENKIRSLHVFFCPNCSIVFHFSDWRLNEGRLYNGQQFLVKTQLSKSWYNNPVIRFQNDYPSFLYLVNAWFIGQQHSLMMNIIGRVAVCFFENREKN